MRFKSAGECSNTLETINSRDGLGEILKSTDRKGQVATFTYDALNRPATATYADGSTVSYTFDLGGRLTKAVDSVGGTITRVYDGLDRLTSETTAQGAVSYTYDAASRLTGLQAPGQALVTYGYDNDDRLTSIVQGAVNVGFGYDNASRRTSATLPNGIKATYVYDAASELTSISYATSANVSLGTLTYTYALDGTINSRSGTLFTSVLPAAVTSSVYNASNQLTSRVTASGTQSPTWDANGSMTSDGLNAYTWDARNRMKSIGSLASYVYDAFGRRVSVTESSTTTSFLYGGASNADIVQVLQGGTAVANLLLGLGIDERLSFNGATYLTDLLGSTIGLSTGSAVQTSYGYDPYGTPTSAGAATINTFQFTGRESDGTAAGLLFYRARYYNPAWGRFVSEDPIGVVGGVNLYAYVRQQPTGLTDPSGLTAAGGAAGAGIGGWAGGVLGGLIDPIGGEVPGALAGRFAGAVIGDWLTGQEPFPGSVTPADCYAAYEAEVKFCQMMKSKKNRALCYAQASEHLAQCLRTCPKIK